jgi:spore coat polysaccharide biosynthesis predicted glycosyltransferase SpsG
MRRADLAVSAAGQTLFELAATGAPTLAIAVADNQRPQLEALGAAGVVIPVTAETLAPRLATVAEDRAMRQALAERGQALVDGLGADRVAHAILEMIFARRSTHG